MGSVFGGGGTVVQAPSSSQTQGTTEIEPWEEVAPYIETLLPQLEAGFNVALSNTDIDVVCFRCFIALVVTISIHLSLRIDDLMSFTVANIFGQNEVNSSTS